MPSIQSIRGFLVRHIRLVSLLAGLALLAYLLNLWHAIIATLRAVAPYLRTHAKPILLTALAATLIFVGIPNKRLPSKHPKHKPKPSSIFIIVFLLCIAVSLLIICFFPTWYVRRTLSESQPSVTKQNSAATPSDTVTAEQRLTHEETERKDTGALLLSLFGAYGLYLTWRRTQTTEQGHITDRYTKAIEQLGALTGDNKPNIEVRLGAIYALERIAWDSPRDHWTIMEVLTAYIRQNAPATTNPVEDVADRKPPTEIQAILDVLQRRNHSIEREDQRLNLTATDLRGANLSGAQLQGAILYRAKLQHAILNRAKLQHANLSGAQLQGAFLYGAKLQDAIGITVPQIKSAGNWKHAYYDPDFLRELGLADEPSPPATEPE